MSSILAAGTVAPNFTLRVTPDQNPTLTDLRGKPVLSSFSGHLRFAFRHFPLTEMHPHAEFAGAAGTTPFLKTGAG
jgi:hypothetical protein